MKKRRYQWFKIQTSLRRGTKHVFVVLCCAVLCNYSGNFSATPSPRKTGNISSLVNAVVWIVKQQQKTETSGLHSNKNDNYLDMQLTNQSALSVGRQMRLLYLPTRIRFPIGGKRVTCRGSKITNSLGRTKLTDTQWKQQHA